MDIKFKGKAIYRPSGRAGEYSYWAVNFYNGCSANCDYCYCKKGVMSHLWSITPTLKKSLIDPEKAMEIFKKEIRNNIHALREHGLFFNFTSDPFLYETIDLNYDAMQFCNGMGVPVKALTKQTWWMSDYDLPDNVTIGFTLTGEDDLEKGAPGNLQRIDSMESLRADGYKVWASIEPVINIDSAYNMFLRSVHFADHFKIGPLSGKKFDLLEVDDFITSVNDIAKHINTSRIAKTIYWKEGFIEKMGINRKSLPENCVDSNYKWWEE